jgi:uncharacterized protein YkwD
MTKKTTVVALSLSTLLATQTAVPVRAQQSPSTTPEPGAVVPAAAARTANPPKVVPVSNSVPAAQPQPAAAPAADPYGFTAWLNATRASYGLGAVGYDPNLTNWAAVNNSHQASRGMGHYVMGPARRQNSAMGHYASVGAMWMASPAHRAALLDPTIRWIGIAGLGAYWTFNAN